MAESEAKGREKSDGAILETALKRFNLAEEAEREIRKEALEDLKFLAGDHWTDEARKARANRPKLTINRLPQFCRQITNDARQNRPAIRVSPVDDGSDVETADIYQGLVRHIEARSNADVAYDTAFESAVRSSIGYMRVLTEYADDTSFDQEIRIARVRDASMVFFDPRSTEPDGSDAQWAFVVEDLLKDDFAAAHPKSKGATTGFEAYGASAPDWMGGDKVRVAEYYWIERVPCEVVLCSDGNVYDADDLAKRYGGEVPEGITVLKSRKTARAVVRWALLTAGEILDQGEWAGRWIPIIPVIGDELVVDGKRVLESAIRHAKDAARAYNYWTSAETEAIALAPKQPWLMPAGADEGFESEWNDPNSRVLHYNPRDLSGNPARPTREYAEPAIQAISHAKMMAADDMKDCIGIQDAGLGIKSNETSGKAILARQHQGQNATFHLVDNLNRSLRHLGRILVDLIPKIYDTARVVRILEEDGTPQMVAINGAEVPAAARKASKYARAFDLNAGRYDVRVDSGPSFQTRRQEAAAAMTAFVQAVPQLMGTVGDLLVKFQDWPGAQEIAERLKRTIPPQILGEDGQGQDPAQLQAQMAQMGEAMQQMQAALQEAHAQLQDYAARVNSKQEELQSRERIEYTKIEADLEKARIAAASQAAPEMLMQALRELEAKIQTVARFVLEPPEGGVAPIPADPAVADPAGVEQDISAGLGLGASPEEA